jgi:methionyl aminopeptidase
MKLDDIDKIVHDFIVAQEAYPSAIDFMHFPKSLCTSVNDVVAHGVPNDYVLQDGDYINLDVVCYKEGHHGDNSGMVMLGNVHPDIQKLSRVTREAMYAAIDICGPGVTFNKIGETIQ